MRLHRSNAFCLWSAAAAAAACHCRLWVFQPAPTDQLRSPSFSLCNPQWDMMQLKKDPRFKEKFPEHAAKEEEEERSLTVRLRSGEQEQQ